MHVISNKIGNYQRQLIYIKYILTHAEYDKEEWKNDP